MVNENDKQYKFGSVTETEDKSVMTRKGDILIIDKNNLIKMIKNNTDKNSVDIDGRLLKLIYHYWGHFSLKQSNWICEKVKYIVRHNKEYKDFRGITDVQLYYHVNIKMTTI
jgi:hypothetical protein